MSLELADDVAHTEPCAPNSNTDIPRSVSLAAIPVPLIPLLIQVLPMRVTILLYSFCSWL
ncbi:MAG: hypothetical protein GPOALKHO_001207 [Sodalis sp.]|nr:MAG: hypothetical protein GPOALKHO_001207 [Sodalis sp.]